MAPFQEDQYFCKSLSGGIVIEIVRRFAWKMEDGLRFTPAFMIFRTLR